MEEAQKLEAVLPAALIHVLVVSLIGNADEGFYQKHFVALPQWQTVAHSLERMVVYAELIKQPLVCPSQADHKPVCHS